MKNIFVAAVLILSISFIYANDDDPDYGETTDQVSNELNDDLKIINSIYSVFSSTLPDFNDSNALSQKKEKDFLKSLKDVNVQYKGKAIKFNYAYLQDDYPEEVITPNGKLKANKMINELKKNPQTSSLITLFGEDPEKNFFLKYLLFSELSNCKDCFKKTGRYIGKFKIGLYNPDYPFRIAHIIKFYKSNDELLEISKDISVAIEGKVIIIDSSRDSNDLNIYIE